jgi:hypothetical protein
VALGMALLAATIIVRRSSHFPQAKPANPLRCLSQTILGAENARLCLDIELIGCKFMSKIEIFAPSFAGGLNNLRIPERLHAKTPFLVR